MRYGYKPDLGDPRDHVWQRSNQPLKPSVDLTTHMPACWDQGQLGSCTGFGITGVVAFLKGFVGSQLWLYYKERLAEGTVRTDSGAAIRDGIKVIASLGLPPEAKWPYVISKYRTKPTLAADRAAKLDVFTEYQRLQSGDDYRDCLSQGHPFVVGISVFESFETEAVATTGVVPMPAAHEKLLGGHCIGVFGYDVHGNYLCRNSWGTGWGRSGYFTLPKAYLDNPNLATDAWVVLG